MSGCGDDQDTVQDKRKAAHLPYAKGCSANGQNKKAIGNKCLASSNSCLTSSNKKLLETIKLLGTSASKQAKHTCSKGQIMKRTSAVEQKSGENTRENIPLKKVEQKDG